ncbi:Pycsar system effector family protein [Microbacterium sp. NPDC003461]
MANTEPAGPEGAVEGLAAAFDVEALRAILATNREEIGRADSKASTLLAAEGIVAGAVLAALIAGDWTPAILPPLAGFAWWFGALVGLASIVALAVSIYPSTKRKRGTKPYGPAFFGDTKRTSGNGHLTLADLLNDQVPITARIARRKYRWIKIGMWLAAVGAASLLFATLIGV